jgi:hypothetical protein
VSIDITVIAIVLLIVVAFIAGTWAGHCDMEKAMQREAVKNGHAEWVTDEHGRATFQWKKGGAK